MVISNCAPFTKLTGLCRAAGPYEDTRTGPNQVLRTSKVPRTGPNQVLDINC